MTIPFPATPDFSGANAPFRMEGDLYDLEVVGTLPPEIRGTWFRCGPDPQYPPKTGDDIYINGDGMMSAFRFENGHIDYKTRYVRTERLVAERAARRSLFGLYRNPFTDDPEAAGKDRTSANTSAFWHGGRLFALKEDGLPYELDAQTLDTKGRWDFGGELRSLTVTAHPKVDPETGEWLFFGYEADGLASTKVAFCTADAKGRLTREEWFDVPYTSMLHDFAVTRDYVIFPVFPCAADLERMKAGGTHWAWDRSLDTWVGIMPRKGSVKDLRWFRQPACFAFHVANAFNEGPKVHVDLCVSRRVGFTYIPDSNGAPFDPMELVPVVTRFSYDLSSDNDEVEVVPLSPLPGELPRIDDRKAFQPTEAIFYVAINPELSAIPSGPAPIGPNQLVRLDVRNGAMQVFAPDQFTVFQEPQFIPSADGGPGYLVVVAEHHANGVLASVMVFKADDLQSGPIARVNLPIRLRGALHGTWVPAHEIPGF
ncbi:carotenoid oxygenase family protein [Paraburkholderia sp. HP33-1]|uniref:carotenoid oxygenase family protein n=1 Tax=Paraburkholderia sp. HP33-1 TaxID=2883243 RepID=UPI001F266E8B|nr:carotenoid oxygenase family protein [Paraburkholderia sp. HP33-1]